MVVRTPLRFTLALALTMAGTAALAQPDRLEGTWECYGPGQTHPAKPPIVWFGPESRGSIEIDGFAGHVFGAADLSQAEGLIRVAPRQGPALVIRGLTSGRHVSMQLSREGVGEYRCLRLPHYDDPILPLRKL